MEKFGIGKPSEVINRLRELLTGLNVADTHLRPFTGLPVMTHAFFPGGNGLYEGVHATRTPIAGTLILGSNFGCHTSFVSEQGQLLALDERSNRTWTPLLDRLHAAEIKADDCFFTNAWPFLHCGEGNLGPVDEWLQNIGLMASCLRFFEYTVTALQPRLVVALGTGPAAFLGHFWPKVLSPWRGYALRHLDDLPMATVHFQDQAAVCVAITHPSMPNAWRRRPPYQHRSGEVHLLAQARLRSKTIARSPSLFCPTDQERRT